jgi:hypothetical protein
MVNTSLLSPAGLLDDSPQPLLDLCQRRQDSLIKKSEEPKSRRNPGELGRDEPNEPGADGAMRQAGATKGHPPALAPEGNLAGYFSPMQLA